MKKETFYRGTVKVTAAMLIAGAVVSTCSAEVYAKNATQMYNIEQVAAEALAPVPGQAQLPTPQEIAASLVTDLTQFAITESFTVVHDVGDEDNLSHDITTAKASPDPAVIIDPETGIVNIAMYKGQAIVLLVNNPFDERSDPWYEDANGVVSMGFANDDWKDNHNYVEIVADEVGQTVINIQVQGMYWDNYGDKKGNPITVAVNVMDAVPAKAPIYTETEKKAVASIAQHMAKNGIGREGGF